MKASVMGFTLLAVALMAAGTAAGYWAGRGRPAMAPPPAPAKVELPVLYWFDPMYPAQHFDAPGKSPFMDMALVPKYADAAQETSSIKISNELTQNLGMRTSPVVKAVLPSALEAVGSLAYNQREVSILQARTAGFVERVYGRAPGDVLPAGTPLVDMLVPEWSGAQLEFIAVLNSEDPRLIEASRERLRLLGMPAAVIDQVARTRKVRAVQTIVTPTAGELQALEARVGMAIAMGQNLARINGLSSVWLDAAVPEAQAAEVEVGASVTAVLSAYPQRPLLGKVIALLPSTDPLTHTLTVRSEIPNPQGKLRPGMFASVQLSGTEQKAVLLIPSEAVIRTGKRALVMVAESDGRYQPWEIQAGRESQGRTEVVTGLTEGQQVVTSGQFLLDSEASLQGITHRSTDVSRVDQMGEAK